MNWFYKEFARQDFFFAILWFNEVGGTYKMDIKNALKSRTYIFYLDHVKLSMVTFFILSCLMESWLYQISRTTLIFYQKPAAWLFAEEHSTRQHVFVLHKKMSGLFEFLLQTTKLKIRISPVLNGGIQPESSHPIICYV